MAMQMYTRSDERETGLAFQRLLASRRPSGVLARFLLGPIGFFLVNTPMFLIQRRLRITPELRLLDVGCGRASALRFLAERVPFRQAPVGVDVSPDILERAHGDCSLRLEFAAATATRLPFAPESFDLILCTYLVRHLGDQVTDRFLYECLRVLRPGGMMLIWDVAPTRSPALNRWHRWLLTRAVPNCHLRSYRNLLDIVVDTNFATAELLTLGPFLFPPIPRTAILLTKAERVAGSG